MRVLLVEDHQLLRAGLRVLCERRAQWKVVGEASNCADALDLVQALQPDILLLDLMLANGSAMDCLPLIRKLFPGGIVILTGEEDHKVHQKARTSGADAVVVKGAEPDELFETIERVLRQRQADASNVSNSPATAMASSVPLLQPAP
jgi:DNA-binding NarL/FixJ family response regulator